MRYVNIRENCIREAQNEYNKTDVSHIAGKANVSVIFTKEHKCNAEFLT